MSAISLAASVTPDPTVLQRLGRPVLVDLGALRWTRGCTALEVQNAIDTGDIKWVWDISCRQSRERCLRFWTREVIAPETCRALSLNEVLLLVLGGRSFWFHASISDLLQCNLAHVYNLNASGAFRTEKRGGVMGVPVTALQQFLRVRLIAPQLPK